MFPVCEACWQEIKTTDEAMLYVDMLLKIWRRGDDDIIARDPDIRRHNYPEIRAAILAAIRQEKK